jgi:catechol 2,3-dioxygenase-like lactoylglutathione lyase family enzyme
MDLGPKVIMGNGSLILAINPPPDPNQALSHDVFSEHRVGLDHLSFSVGSRGDLEAAVRLFDENGISHGTINDLGEYGLPIYVLAFRDPDNIQLELTAPKA